MQLRVTTYRRRKGRYIPVTDRLERYGEIGEHSNRLDLAASAVRRVPGCSRVQVGADTWNVGSIAGHLLLTSVRWRRPNLPAWLVPGSMNNDPREDEEEKN